MSRVQTQGQNNVELAMVRLVLLNKKNVSKPCSKLAKIRCINSYSNMPSFTQHLISNVNHSK